MAPHAVYTGVWKNWNAKNTMSQLTWTISPSEGPFLIAFIALFVGVASSHLWNIVAFTLHQSLSTIAERDLLHHELLLSLRNSSSSASFLWVLTKLVQTWWKKAKRMWRLPLLALPAITHLTFLAVAGIFSSKITLSGDKVLARGSTCGWMEIDTNRTSQNGFGRQAIATADWSMGRWQAIKALSYAKTCYNSTNLADSGACKSFTVPAIKITTNNSVPCPFSENICALPYAFSADTGLVDSSFHLGVNSHPKKRLRFRKVLTCAPLLAEERYSSDWGPLRPTPGNNEPEPLLPGNQFKYYHLGTNTNKFGSWNISGTISNFTLWSMFPGYDLQAISKLSGESSTDFLFIPELRVVNADVSILSLLSTIGYRSQVEDPWFLATNKSNSHLTGSQLNFIFASSPSDDVDLTFYPNRILSTLGCTEKYEYCNTTSCSGLQGILTNASTPYFGLSLNDEQKAIFNTISVGASGVTVAWGAYFLGSDLLLAKEKIWSPRYALSSPLPSDQWQREVAFIIRVMLAALQRRVVNFASPPDISLQISSISTSSLNFIMPPATDAEKRLCKMIRIRNAAYYNFDIVGLTIVLVLGSLVIILNVFCLPDAAFAARRKGGKATHSEDEWVQTSLMRLFGQVMNSGRIGSCTVHQKTDIPFEKNGNARYSSRILWSTSTGEDVKHNSTVLESS